MNTEQTCNHTCANYVGKHFCSNDKNTTNKTIHFDRNIKDNNINTEYKVNKNTNPCKPFNSPSFSNIGVL